MSKLGDSNERQSVNIPFIPKSKALMPEIFVLFYLNKISP